MTFGWTGVDVPAVGQGTWTIGRQRGGRAAAGPRPRHDPHRHGRDVRQRTAEELVGEAIAGRRDEVFLVSKVLPSNASYEGTLRACERSLRRLGTDHLDLYLLHWAGSAPDPARPCGRWRSWSRRA